MRSLATDANRTGQAAYRPFPEVAGAIQSQSDRILDEWRGRTLFSMPQLAELTVREFMDSIARRHGHQNSAWMPRRPADLRVREISRRKETTMERKAYSQELTERATALMILVRLAIPSLRRA